MPRQHRLKTKYPGVYYIEGQSLDGKPEKIFYMMYRKNGKLIDEKAGRQFQDDMTPARASSLRTEKIRGHELTNKEKREAELAEKAAAAGRWTIDRLWVEYKRQKPDLKGLGPDESRYQKYLKTPFGAKEPKQLAPLDVDRVRLKMLKTKSPQTAKLTLALLRRICNFGSDKRLCDPLDFKIEIPNVHNEKTEDLTPDQLRKLLEAIEKDGHAQAGSLMKMALYTGMRRGEMLNLQWDDIDFRKGFIRIRDPKGGVDQIIPLNDTVRELLKSQPRSKSEYVFPGRNGEKRVDINHQLSRIKKSAGLPKDFRALHGLRHVYASMLASSGQVDLYTLQKLLTHKSPVMTQRYAHLRDEALKRASNLAGTLIDRALQNNPAEENDQKVANSEKR